MNEVLNVAELKLDCRLDVVVSNNGTECLYDLLSPGHVAPVVIGRFEDEEVLEHVTLSLRNLTHERSLFLVNGLSPVAVSFLS
jgi:hypothetical protein